MTVTNVLQEQSGIQYGSVTDKSEADPRDSMNNVLFTGEFKRGRFDQPMKVLASNIRAVLGYDPDNMTYVAIEDALAAGAPFVWVQRIKIEEDTSGEGGSERFVQNIDMTGRFAIVTGKVPNAYTVHAINDQVIDFSSDLKVLSYAKDTMTFRQTIFAPSGNIFAYYESDASFTNYKTSFYEFDEVDFTSQISFNPPLDVQNSIPLIAVSPDDQYILFSGMHKAIHVYKKSGAMSYTRVHLIEDAEMFTGLEFSPDSTKFCFIALGDTALKVYSLEDGFNLLGRVDKPVSVNWPAGNIVYSPVWLNSSMIYRIICEKIENTDTGYNTSQSVIEVSGDSLSYHYEGTDSVGFYGTAHSNYTGGALINIDSYRHGDYGYSLAMLNTNGSVIHTVKDFSELRDKKCFILQSNESEIRIIAADANIYGDAGYRCKIIVFNKATQSYSVR